MPLVCGWSSSSGTQAQFKPEESLSAIPSANPRYQVVLLHWSFRPLSGQVWTATFSVHTTFHLCSKTAYHSLCGKLCCKDPPPNHQLRPETVSQLHQLTFAIRWQSTNASLSLRSGVSVCRGQLHQWCQNPGYWGASEDFAKVLCLSLPWLLLELIWHVLLMHAGWWVTHIPDQIS